MAPSLRKTHGWYQEQFITIKVARKLLGIFILMLVLPMLKKLKISDINLLIIFNFLHAIGFFLGSLSMYGSGFLLSGEYQKYKYLDKKSLHHQIKFHIH